MSRTGPTSHWESNQSQCLLPGCLSPALLDLSLWFHVLAHLRRNDPVQTQKQFLKMITQPQAKVLTSISYQSKWILEPWLSSLWTATILHAGSKYRPNYFLFRTNSCSGLFSVCLLDHLLMLSLLNKLKSKDSAHHFSVSLFSRWGGGEVTVLLTAQRTK